MNIIPIILCGGSGSRLFPLSRKNIPKQFLDLENNGMTLFQNTIQRLIRSPLEPTRIALISNKQYEHIISHQLKIFDIKVDLFLEPVSRNTAPAILFTLEYYYKELDSGANLMYLPADHVYDQVHFNELISRLKDYKEFTALIFGVQPTYPETGYGYIHFRDDQVISFEEKPCASLAQKYFSDPGYNWNSGMFLFQKDVLAHFKSLHPEMGDLIQRVLKQSRVIDDKIYIHDDFKDCQDISIDYALMEKIPHLTKFLSYRGDWSDIGSFTSLLKYSKDSIDFDSHNNYVNTRKKTILHHVHDLVIAESDDIIMISDVRESQKIKDAYKQLPSELISNQCIDYRPWGFYEVILDGANCKIKKITVYPKKRLSLQSHLHRAEHWICLAGLGRAQVNDELIDLLPDRHVFVKRQDRHRMINDGDQDLVIIEIQTGDYFGEDDIIRYEDDYGRTS